MNAEVLAEAVRAYVQAGKRGLKLDEAMACALEIAYADAARVCREYADGLETRFPDPHLSGRIDASNSLSEAIEGRAQ